MRDLCLAFLFSIFLSCPFAEPVFANVSQQSAEVKVSALELGFFSIPVDDLKIAQSFYEGVMGWEFKERDSGFSYVFANGNMIGSIELSKDNFRPSANGPLLFFRADFMDKTLLRVIKFGGTVNEKLAMENGARGYTAKIQDPFKNTIAFWAPEE